VTAVTYQSTQVLYDASATNWVRSEPISLSDFTARPVVLGMCEPIANLQVLDLGCGEGYCSRELMRRGAASVYGIDLSAQMIAAAQVKEVAEPLGIRYEAADATAFPQVADASVDVALAVFLFNYLTVAQMQQCMQEVMRVLKPGGRFIFSVPHPSFPYMREAAYPFYFAVQGADAGAGAATGYFSQRDQQFPGKIWKRDGSDLDVQLVHKPLEDYFDALRLAGFQGMPIVRELRVLPEHVQLDPDFFQPLFDYPLHLAFQVTR
jgi:SAM-dependent methyltransferase